MELIHECISIVESNKDITMSVHDSIFTIKTKKNQFDMTINANHLCSKKGNYATEHLIRILTFNKLHIVSEENVFDLILFINHNICNIFEFCTLCFSKIFNTGNVNVCDKCVNKSMLCILDDTVVNCYKQDKIVFNVLVASAYACLVHPKSDQIFKPFPVNYCSVSDLKKDLKFSIDTISDLIKIMEDMEFDHQLEHKIGTPEYGFLKFVIMTNITDLRSDMLFSDKKNIFNQKIVNDIMTCDDVLTLLVTHEPKIESKFATDNPQYLFHGSSLSNWYSILRNGLQNYSATTLMANGAVHGSGIYLSDTLNVSFSYGKDKYAKSSLVVIGVVQVLKPKDTYKKCSSIFVVKNGDETMLKYIIITRKQSQIEEITKYFMTQRTTEIMNASQSVRVIQAKRLMHDYEKMDKIAKKNNWKFTEVNETLWNIDFGTGILAVKIPSDYPLKEPFLWLLSINAKIEHEVPLFDKTPNKILSHGAIYIEDIAPHKWISNKKIYIHIKKIIQALLLFEKTIDTTVYSEEAAFNQYSGVVKLFGGHFK